MSRYSIQPDPRNFAFGNAFLGGVQQADDQQQQQAMMDQQSQRMQMAEQQQAMLMHQFMQEQQDRQNAAGQQQAGVQRRAQILSEILPDQFKPMAAELAAELDEGDIAKMIEQRSQVEQPKLIEDHTGQLVAEAPGVRPYHAPQAPKGPGTLYQVVGEDGQPRFVSGEEALGQQPFKPDANKGPTEADKRVGNLFGSMVGAEKAIAGLSGDDTSSLKNTALGSNPVTAVFQGEDFRKYESAALRWAANLLYIKSGATAPPEEVRSTYKQFFPQPGESQAVKDQKKVARDEEMENIKAQYPAVAQKYGSNSRPTRPGQQASGGPFSDPEKEKRYQEFKRRQTGG